MLDPIGALHNPLPLLFLVVTVLGPFRPDSGVQSLWSPRSDPNNPFTHDSKRVWPRDIDAVSYTLNGDEHYPAPFYTLAP